MNRCERIQDQLKAYQDGELSVMTRQQVRRHLRGCAGCRKELSVMEQTSKELREDAPKPLETSLREKILASAGGVGPNPGERKQPIPKWRRKPMIAWGAVSAALIAWFALYPVLHRHQEPTAKLESINGVASAPMAEMMKSPASSASDPREVLGNGSAVGIQYQQATIPMPKPRVVSEQMKAMKAQLGKAPATPNPVGTQDYDEAVHKPHFDPNTITVSPGYFGLARMGSSGESEMVGKVAMAEMAKAHRPVHSVTYAETSDNRRRVAAVANSVTYAEGSDAERVMHKEAQVTLQVDNVEAKSETIEQITQSSGGYVADNQLSTGDDNTKTASITLQVPVDQFQNVLIQVVKLGDVKAKNVSRQDLTDEISDHKQAEHALKQDIQIIQEQLTYRLSRSGREERMDTLQDLRTRIAQKQAHLKQLQKMGATSTISVELDEKPRPVPAQPHPHTSGFMNEMNDSLHDAVHSMMQAARLPILTFIWILAYSPLWILLILGYRWAVRR